jgi:hypothetical protein
LRPSINIETSTSSSNTQHNITTYVHPMTPRLHDNTRRVRTFSVHISLSTSHEIEPTTLLQANSQPNWRHAMATEMNALPLNKTWICVLPPSNHNSIGCKWVYKIKRRADDSIER